MGHEPWTGFLFTWRGSNKKNNMEKFKLSRLYDVKGDLSQRWYVYFFYKNPETNKNTRFKDNIPSRFKTAISRRQWANDHMSKINKRLLTGWNPFSFTEKRHTNIIQAMKFVLEFKETTLRKRSFYTYRYQVHSFEKWLFKMKYQHLSVGEFNQMHAQQFMDYSKMVLKLSNRTYNYRRMHMRCFFSFLMKRDWILSNPFMCIEKLPIEEPEITCFTVDELIRVQDKLPEEDFELYAVACLIFYCFLRPAEIVRMRIRNFNFYNNTIVVAGTISKNRKHETVQIPDALVPVLRLLPFEGSQDRYAFSKDLMPGTVEIAPTRIAGRWRAWADKHAINKNIYSLKHTGVGMAIEAGINLRDLQLQLRHSSLDMTQVYVDKFRRHPSEKLSRSFPNLSALSANKRQYAHFSPAEEIRNPGLS